MNYLNRISSRIIRTGQSMLSIFSLSCILILPAAAQTTITLKQALGLTLQNNAELKSFPLAVRGAEAMQLQAEARPTPTLRVEVENALGSGDYQSFDSSEISITYSQMLELGNKQQNRLQFATAKTRRLQSEYQLARLDILAETNRRYYQNILLEEQLRWIKRRILSENKALQVIKKRAKAGAVGEADVSKMALRVARSDFQKEQLISQLKQAQIRLAAMWMAEPEFSSLGGNFSAIPTIPERELVLKAIEKLPSMQHQLALQRVSDSRLKLAQSNGQSDMTFTVGLKQHQLTSDQSLNFAFSMPLAFENPNRGRIKAARIAIEQTNLETESFKQQLKLTLLEIRQQLLSLKAQAESLNNKLLPQAKKLLAETEKGYQKGHYSVLQWIDAQSELFSIERSLINVHWQVYQQYLELERITGQSMTTISAPLTGEKK